MKHASLFPTALSAVTLLSTITFAAPPVMLEKLLLNNTWNSDWFGYSTAMSGDILVIGVLQDDGTTVINTGSAYVYRISETAGTATRLAKLTVSDPTAYQRLGSSVAISGNTIILGASGDDDMGNDAGAAYLFQKTDDWRDMNETLKLTAPDSVAGDQFGQSVAIFENSVVVGANLHDTNGSNSGYAYLFEAPDGNWSNGYNSARLTASDAAESDAFGSSVAIWNDVVAIGAIYDDNSGSVYLFEKPLPGWSDANETLKLKAPDAATGDNFGNSIAIGSAGIVVGSQRHRNGASFAGSAYLFETPADGWSNVTGAVKFTASDAAYYDLFGSSVAIDGTRIVVGASKVNSNSGAAYLFEKPVSGWSDMNESVKFFPEDVTAGDQFGYSIGISGQLMIGCSIYDDNGTTIDSGSCYLFGPEPVASTPLSPSVLMYLLQ